MDVIKSMKSFIKVSQICGLFPYKVQKSNNYCFLTESRPLFRYTKVLFWVVAVSEWCSIASSNFSVDYSDEISTKLVLLLSTLTLYISFILIFRTVCKKRGVLCFWLNQFNNLCLTCTVNANSRNLERFNSRLLLATTSYFFLVVTTKYLTYEQVSVEKALADFLFFGRLWVIHLFLKHFVLFASWIRFFYYQVNKNFGREMASKISRSWLKLLRDLRSKDLFVKDFAEVLNSIYMPVLLVQLMWFFATLLCDITLTGRAGMPTPMQVDWMFYICTETVLYVSVCHVTVAEERKTICCLQDLFINEDDPELLYEVELFSLQLQHTNLNFNALGFFVLDYTLLYSMIGATTTYTVILLQFQSEHITKSQRTDTNTSLFAAELFHMRPTLKNTSD